MSGRAFAIGFGLFTLFFAILLWWMLQRGWVEEVSGVTEIEIAGRSVPVSEYRGIDSDGPPLKLRGCFTVDPAMVEGPAPTAPTPLVAPGWFDCFDARALQQALDDGRARAVVAQAGELPQIDRIVAVYPDGRGYQWRQLAEGVEPR